MGLTMALIKELTTEVRSMKVQNKGKKAPMVLMEDNLTKAKRALGIMADCTIFARVRSKAQLGAADRATISNLRETMIKKSREFHKFSRDWNKGKPGVQISIITH